MQKLWQKLRTVGDYLYIQNINHCNITEHFFMSQCSFENILLIYLFCSHSETFSGKNNKIYKFLYMLFFRFLYILNSGQKICFLWDVKTF